MKRILLCCTAGRFASMGVDNLKPGAKAHPHADAMAASGVKGFTTYPSRFYCCLSALRDTSRPAGRMMQPVATEMPAPACRAGNPHILRSGHYPAGAPHFIACLESRYVW